MIKISNCDLFIYVGGESDVWVDDALKNAQNKDMHVINLMEVMGDSAKTEEVKEGMMAESEEEYDEHFWNSLKNAELFCSEICSALCSIDPENAEKYNNTEDIPPPLHAAGSIFPLSRSTISDCLVSDSTNRLCLLKAEL